VNPVTPELLGLLALTAGVAGCIDAIAGGGGLLTLPALLGAGLAPVEALATNKLQGSFGTASATLRFLRHGAIDLRALAPAALLSFAGAAGGSRLVSGVDPGALARLLPLLLVAFALYFLLSPRVGDLPSRRRIGLPAFGLLAGAGTGSFFALAFVALLGCGLREATAGSKLLNFASNVASLAVFALGGHVAWTIGLAMAVGQWGGAWLGAHLVIRHGARLVRPLLVAVSLLLSVRLLVQQLGA
jgi:uncharacterized membrane protein YfcA